MLGSNLAHAFRGKFDLLGLYCSHPVSIDGVETQRVDLLSQDSLKPVVKGFKPDVVIHCASLADVDLCERNRELAKKTNILGTQAVVESLEDCDAKLIYISTDLVYDGQRGDYSETDPPSPPNYYGKSKYEGELEALKHPHTLVFRTNIFGWNIQEKEGLAEWIIHRLKEGQVIKGFVNARFSSIYTLELAWVLELAARKDLLGIYNCGSPIGISKYEFAVRLADRFRLDRSLVEPTPIEEFNFDAKRGTDLTLNVGKLAEALDCALPTIDDSIEKFYGDYKSGFPKIIKRKPYADDSARRSMSPYGRQSIDDDDIRSVIAVLKSSYLTQGPKVGEFEDALCRITGSKFAVAVNSGTSALHIACLSANIGPGDEVITSPNTFVASANCIVYCGARPVFGDIDPRTYNLSPETVEMKITGRVKAVIPVHFAGQSCDMEAMTRIKNRAEKKFGHKIYIIEDAAHALGSTYKGTQVGSCSFSDMAVLSFHPVKHITTGEGGAVLTNDEELYRRLKRLRNHGMTSDPAEFVNPELRSDFQASIPPWYYEQVELGFNYRITDIQCALGISQARKLPRFMKRRREIVDQYNAHFEKLDLAITPYESAFCQNNFHLYVLLIDFEKRGLPRADVMAQLEEKGVKTQVHFIPVHTQPLFRNRFGTQRGDCPHAEKYYDQCLSIPLFPAMLDSDVQRVIQSIRSVVQPERISRVG